MRASSCMGFAVHAVLGVAAALPLVAFAASPQAAPAASAAGDAAVDPAAVAALDRIGKALAGLKEFALTSNASTDYVLDDGQKIQANSTVSYRVRKPDRLYVRLQGDRGVRDLYYDGDSLTLYSPATKFYASARTQGRTLAQLVTNAATRYDVQFPLTDLFLWGTRYAPNPAEVLTGAMDVGPATIDGVETEHYAFRQQGTDWQVWLAKSNSLPQQLVIVTTTDPSMPQYEARLHWSPAATFDSASFIFTPPSGAKRITIAPTRGAAVGSDGEGH